jgi:cell division transport system permease protein
MKKTIRNFNRMWKNGIVKSFRLPHIFLPLVIFFSIVLSLGSSVFVAYNFSKHIIAKFENKINIVVLLNRKISSEIEEKTVAQIKARPDVKEIVYSTQKEVLEDFKLKHKDDPVSLSSLSELSENPFGAEIVVSAYDSKNYEVISKEILDMNKLYIDDKGVIPPVKYTTYEEHKVPIDSFANMLNKGSLVASLIAISLAIVLLFTLYLALKFANQGEKEEMKIMKLVGASSMLTVGPTAVMGMLAGLIGSIISILLLYFLTQNITPYTLAFDNFNAFTWYIKNIKLFLIGNISFGLLFGFVGSILAVSRFLRN